MTKQLPNVSGAYIGFEALHVVRYQYIWFAVTPCVNLLARWSLFFENCLALFYYRGVRLFGCSGAFSVLKRTVLPINYYLRADGPVP